MKYVDGFLPNGRGHRELIRDNGQQTARTTRKLLSDLPKSWQSWSGKPASLQLPGGIVC